MNDKKLRNFCNFLAYSISALGLVLCLRIMAGYEDVIGPALNISMILLAAAVAVALAFGTMQLFGDFKKNVPLILSLAVLLVIGFICYSVSSDEVLKTYVNVTPTVSKLSGAGVLYMFILLGAAIVVAIGGEIWLAFK